MEHIKKLKEELEELELKLKKGNTFLESEIANSQKTNEAQRLLLGIQLTYMTNYAATLKTRIRYEEELNSK